MTALEHASGLVGDIGGTKTLLSLFDVEDGKLRLHHRMEFASRDYPHLEGILARFIEETGYDGKGAPAAFGVAGPVSGRQCKTLNLPWLVDAAAIESAFGFPRVGLLNDFESVVHGISELKTDDLLTLNPGRAMDSPQPIAVLGAGTGLGEGGGYPDPAAVITRYAALEPGDSLCRKAVELFVSIYGAEAGNLALKFLARGGVYLAGGIAPKILGHLKEGTFLRSFVRKGRYRELMEGIPVHVILNPDVGLLGAARVASLLTA
jgi:glucokinase